VIILDTNVISELMNGERAEPSVVDWLRTRDQQPVTTVINKAEILSGIALLPAGRKRDALMARAEDALSSLGRCLPLIADCAQIYANMVASRRGAGRALSEFDGLVAAIAHHAGASVATRDIGGFEGLGIEVVNPWEFQG
jgi:predicted nucleic acid-binding protein